jgi:hypothetical protein
VFADYASYGWNRGNCDVRSPAQSGDIFKPGQAYGFTPSDGVFISKMDAGLDYATGQALAAKHAADPTWWQPDNTYRIKLPSITDGLTNTIAAGDMHNILKGYTTTRVNGVSIGDGGQGRAGDRGGRLEEQVRQPGGRQVEGNDP